MNKSLFIALLRCLKRSRKGCVIAPDISVDTSLTTFKSMTIIPLENR